jgi:DNA-binding GntR family transcriptional regulator
VPSDIQITSKASAADAANGGLSLTKRAYQALRNEIITCQLAPGSEISEHELSDSLGMSKTPVREALVRLAGEGLVEAFPRRAYRIAPITIQSVNELFGVRAALESASAALAAARMTAADIAALQALANASYQVEESKSRSDFVDANRQFHLAISGYSGNSRMHALIVGLVDQGERFFHMGAQMRDVNSETNHEHHQLVEVLGRGDAERARLLMIEHIDSTRRGLLLSLISAAHPGVRL